MHKEIKRKKVRKITDINKKRNRIVTMKSESWFLEKL